jgi:hypothetical protein
MSQPFLLASSSAWCRRASSGLRSLRLLVRVRAGHEAAEVLPAVRCGPVDGAGALMPGTPKPVADPRFGPHWSAVLQAIQANTARTAAQASSPTRGNVFDQYGNTVELSGANLNQIVTIGAVWGQAGVQVSTGLANGSAGRARQENLATGTVTLETGTNVATVDATVSGTFAIGQVIGAADVSDPTSGLATASIVPGTVIGSVSGATLTLTPPSGHTDAVAESGTGLYCAACDWVTS